MAPTFRSAMFRRRSTFHRHGHWWDGEPDAERKLGPTEYFHSPYDTWADLSACSLLVDDELFVVTEEGMRLAGSFTGEVLGLKQNVHVLRTLDAVVEKYAVLDTAKLLDEVYSMHCYTLDSPGRKHRVSAVAEGREFTRLLEEDEAEEALFVPPGWQITLELTFRPDALRNLQRGIEDSHAGRVSGWEAVRADV